MRKTRKEYDAKYRLTHLEKRRAESVAWLLANPEKGREATKKYRLTHKEKMRNSCKKWRLNNPEKLKAGIDKWQLANPNKVKEAKSKNKAKRKQFGFIPLNNYFNDSNGHHIDSERVIYIPTEMHEYNRHSVLKDRGMAKINTLSFNWLEAEELYVNYTRGTLWAK